MGYDFQSLTVWKKAVELLKKVYLLSSKFPKDERYALTDQLRRSANSVAANIAEAQGRHFKKDKIRVLYQSRGEIEETRSHLLVSGELGYGKANDINPLVDEYNVLGKQINALIRSILE